MDDNELRSLLTRTAEEFPVRGGPPGLRRRVMHRRRIAIGLAGVIGSAAVVASVLAVSSPSTPAASHVAGGAGYVGSNWRLTSVGKGTTETSIPASLGAQMSITPHGQIFIFDGVNSLTGSYTTFTNGFEVRNVISTAVGYAGGDASRLAAITALDTLADGTGRSATARDVVISVDKAELLVRAGAYRLTFIRTGPAREPS